MSYLRRLNEDEPIVRQLVGQLLKVVGSLSKTLGGKLDILL